MDTNMRAYTDKAMELARNVRIAVTKQCINPCVLNVGLCTAADEALRQHIEQGEPLPRSYLSSILTSMSDGTVKVSIFFGDAQEAEAWFDTLTERQENKS